MKHMTKAALLAWKIAAVEARAMGSDTIEKEHLFIGLMSLQKAADSKTPDNTGGSREWQAIRTLLAISCHDPVVLRRIMRRTLGKTPAVPDNKTLHRSADCRGYFHRAEIIAGDRPVSANDLFSSIMERPGTIIPEVLAESRQFRPADRDTDVFLPTGTMSNNTRGFTRTGIDITALLAKEVTVYAESREAWSLATPEYEELSAALKKKSITLAILTLEDLDTTYLILALGHLRSLEPGEAETINPIISELDQFGKTHQPVSRSLKIRITSLLNRLGEQPGDLDH